MPPRLVPRQEVEICAMVIKACAIRIECVACFRAGFFVRALWVGFGRILGARAMRVLLEKIGRGGLMENSGRLLRRRPVHNSTTLSR